MEQSRKETFWQLQHHYTSSNLDLTSTPRSSVNWLSGIPPAPTIRYAKKHLEGSQESYSNLVANTCIVGASFSLPLSFAFSVEAILPHVSCQGVVA